MSDIINSNRKLSDDEEPNLLTPLESALDTLNTALDELAKVEHQLVERTARYRQTPLDVGTDSEIVAAEDEPRERKPTSPLIRQLELLNERVWESVQRTRFILNDLVI